jgi:iron complex outermembrane receptor protein
MNKSFLLIASIILTGSIGAQAQQNLNEVQVKGRKKTLKERAEFQRHAQTTEVLTEEELNRNNPAFIEQSLNTVAGVQVDKRTQLGGQRIVIRGYGNDQKFNNWGIKAYYNGIPLTTAEGITNLDDIDFSLVNNIEVIKGPAATEYGAGVGGVARFYLKTSDVKGVQLSEKFIAGSYDLLQSHTRVDVVGENSSIAVNYSHLQSNGYRPHSASLKNYFSSFGDFRISPKQKLSYYISHNYSHDEVSGQISYADYYAGVDNGNTAYIKKNARNNILMTRVGLSHQYAITKGLSNFTTLFYSNGDYKTVSAGADGTSNIANYGARSVFVWKANMGSKFSNMLEAGTEVQETRQLTSSYRFTGTNNNPLQVNPVTNGASYFKYITNQLSFFAIDRVTYKPWELTLVAGISANTVRYRRDDLFAAPGLIVLANNGVYKDLSFEKNYETSVNPHIALQKVWKKQIFQVSYSEGYNAPTASSTFIAALTLPNDTLLPEKGRMWEFGVQGLLANTHLDYQFSIFRLNVDDKLSQLSGINPANNAPYNYFANTGRQRNQGIELSVGYVWTPKPNAVISSIEPFVSGSLYDFTYMDFRKGVNGVYTDYSTKQVVGVPREKYVMGIDLKNRMGFYANTTFYYFGDVYSDFANTNKVGSFTQLNAKIGYQRDFALSRFMPKRFSIDVFVAGNNLSNQVNYTFLFLGNNINDADAGSNYPAGTFTDITPGASQSYFFGGVGLKCRL